MAGDKMSDLCDLWSFLLHVIMTQADPVTMKYSTPCGFLPHASHMGGFQGRHDVLIMEHKHEEIFHIQGIEAWIKKSKKATVAPP